MLLCFILLFSLCGSTVKCASTTSRFPTSINTATATEEMLPVPEIVAEPDYPVAAGQDVHLNCNSTSISIAVNWTWLHQQDKWWKEVGFERDLTLTKPEESGVYLCQAKTQKQMKQSQNYNVYIVSLQATAGENLGKAAFALSILILVAIIAGVVWFFGQRHGDKPTSSSPLNRSVPEPKVVAKACSPQADSDVYMNYTNTNQSYVDLNPARLNQDNLYSTLS